MQPTSALIVAWALAAATGCALLAMPCDPADDACVAAADFAEEQMRSDEWQAVVAEEIDCEPFAANRGGIDPERCWRVEMESATDPGSRREADVVLTTAGDFVRFGESRPLSR